MPEWLFVGVEIELKEGGIAAAQFYGLKPAQKWKVTAIIPRAVYGRLAVMCADDGGGSMVIWRNHFKKARCRG